MKRSLGKTLVGIGLVAGALGLVGVAVAHPGSEGREGRKAAFMAKYDTNGDGKIDDAEREAMRAAHEARRAEMLAKFDTNKDGKLDDAERKAMHLAFAAERFKQLDTNGDGKLSLEEFQAGAGRFGHHRPR